MYTGDKRMKIFPDIAAWSLRKKLVSIIILSSTICLLVSFSILVLSSVVSRNKEAMQEISALAGVLAENGQAALMFSDRTEAQRLLESLRGHREISAAWLVDDKGAALASWNRQGAATALPPDYREPQLHSPFWARQATIYQPVTRDSEQIGHVVLKADFTEQWRDLWSILQKGLAGALFALLLILPFAWYFANTISRPLTMLSRIFRGVASGRQPEALNRELYQLGKLRQDDLVGLIQGFIAMHEAVNQKIQQINELNLFLEQKIRDRTSALFASEQEYRTLIENTPDTIARYDRECRRIYANPAFIKLTVGGAAALLGKKPSENPGGPNSLIYETKIREVYASGNNTHFELKWPSTEGKEICSHVRLTAEFDTFGNICSVLGAGRDISELNAYRAELQRKELAKSRFLAAAGHDLRQPLSAANLYIDALKQTSPNEKQERIIQRLVQSMTTFNGLLDALLNISKLDAGVIKPEYTPIGVAELFIWLDLNFASLFTEKKLSFKLYFPMKEFLVVQSDLNLLKSMFMNLVGNSLKYTIKGGILVSARRRANTVLFQVWDTGIGVQPEHLGQIYDEFYQVNNPQRDRTSGLGLGLSIVKRAITLIGGKITCRSQFGRGTVFSFHLPCANEPVIHPISTYAIQEDRHAQTFVRGKRFVVVEDDELVAQAMISWLEGMGAEVKCFNSAEDALLHPDINDADYYIADYMLGGMLDGVQLLNQLRLKLDRPLNAVLVTGDTSAAIFHHAEHCAWPILHKPIDISLLIESLGGPAL
jgi:PAS domain S-box-containing protein